MSKITTNKPVLIMLYGVPGAGKTHFAQELTGVLQAAHVQADRIRYELFEQPTYDKQENNVVIHLMEYMTQEFLNAGVSVIYDTNVMRLVQRRALRDIATKAKVQPIMVWLQIDNESAFARTANRDRRRSADKYAQPYDKKSFNQVVINMQKPQHEEYVVVSGKHTFTMQRSALIKKLYDLGLISGDNAANNVTKPGMVNLIPTAGRVDMQRRNVVIR
jgi:predicted kinase